MVENFTRYMKELHEHKCPHCKKNIFVTFKFRKEIKDFCIGKSR